MGKKAPLSNVDGFDRFMRRLKRRIDPSVVLLFGSRARADHLRNSDIDLVIVSDAFNGMPWRDRMHLVLRLWDGEVALEPLCYTRSEFATRSKQASIVREAARTGLPLPL